MENKYYTPTLEEFHVGFEYQQKTISTKEWVDVNYTHLDKDTKYIIDENRIRVKHLDQEDIESCGFFLKKLYYYYKYEESGIRLDFFKGENVEIERFDLDTMEWRYIFKGKPKNKSEFKRILKQIGI